MNLMKLLWNLSNETYNLWIKWIHTCYIKDEHAMSIPVKDSYSWILKTILKHGAKVHQMQVCMQQGEKFEMKKMYLVVHNDDHMVIWRKMFYYNFALPRA